MTLEGFLLCAAGFVLAMVAIGLIRILRGPGDADRMMAAQLFSTGGIATLLLIGVATGTRAIGGVALTLAVLSTFAAIAFVKRAPTRTSRAATGSVPEP